MRQGYLLDKPNIQNLQTDLIHTAVFVCSWPPIADDIVISGSQPYLVPVQSPTRRAKSHVRKLYLEILTEKDILAILLMLLA